MADEDTELRIRIARARLLAADKGGGGTAVAEPPPKPPATRYPTYDASPDTLAIWGGGDPAAAETTPPEVRGRRMQSHIYEEGRKEHLRALYADLSPRERGAAARSINEGLPRWEHRTVHQMAPEEVMAEHLRTKGTNRSPLLTETGRTAVDFLESSARVVGGALNLVMGDPEQATKAVTNREPGTGERTTIYRGEDSQDRLEGAVARTGRFVMDPIGWFGFGGTAAGAKAVGMAGKGLSAAEVASLRAVRGPISAEGFLRVREEALTALRRVRDERSIHRAMTADNRAALDRLISKIETAPSAQDIKIAMGSDEARQVAAEFTYPTGGPAGHPAGQAVHPSEGVSPLEVPAARAVREDRLDPSRGYQTAPATVPAQNQTIRLGAAYETAEGRGTIGAVQPSGRLRVDLPDGRKVWVEPGIPAEAPPRLTVAPEGPPGPLGATEKPPTTAPLPGAQASPAAPSAPPAALQVIANDPSVPHPTWTAAVDRVTDGMGSWMDARFPAVMHTLRQATGASPYHATDRTLGALHETYLSNLGNLRGEAADVLGPAEKALGKAKPTVEETEAFFRYASNRSAEVPQIVRDHPEIGKALDWYNTVLRPELVKRGALSKEALEEFDRYLPNILTAKIDRPGRRTHAYTGSPRASVPGLRENYPGAVLESVTKDEARALADSLKGTIGEPIVVGPYGKNSYIKFSTDAERDTFLKALDNERRGAGLKSGKIRYRSFDKIPDEWLERSVEEGGGGLVKDPMGLLAHAMDRGTKEIAAREFYEGLASHPAVRDLAHGEAPAAGYAAIPDTPRWGALRGKQVPKEFHEALTGYEVKDPSVLGNAWRGMIRAFKGNVLLNSATISRNAIYDANTLATYNHMSFGSPAWWKNLTRSTTAYREWTKTGVRPEAVRAFQEGGGLLNNDVLSSEALDRIDALLKGQKEGKVTVEQFAEEFTHLSTGSPRALQGGAGDASGVKSAARSVAGGVTSGARSLAQGEGVAAASVKAATGAGQTMAVGKAIPSAEKIYQSTDDYFKLAYFENWRDIFRKAHPDLPPAEIDRLAAREVNARSQLVQFRSPIARELTNSGIQPFAWWWDQMVRIDAYMLKNDPVRFAIMKAQGTSIKAAAGTAVSAATGIPVSVLYGWMKRNPGMLPISAEKDEKGEWIVAGARYQSALPDPVAAGLGAATDPGVAGREAFDSLAFSNPVFAVVARGGSLLHGGVEAMDPTFGEHRRLVESGETPAAAALRLYYQSFGSPVAPEGRQSQDVRELVEGDTTKGKYQTRSVGRTASGLLGATIYESPADSAEFATRRFAAESRDMQGWLRDAMKDPDTKGLPQDHPERRRLWQEYESMLLDAYEEALQGGAKIAPPLVRTPDGAEKLKAILAHHGLTPQPAGAGR